MNNEYENDPVLDAMIKTDRKLDKKQMNNENNIKLTLSQRTYWNMLQGQVQANVITQLQAQEMMEEMKRKQLTARLL